MTEVIMAATARGLTQTAVEKICVFGIEDSKADVEKLREVLDDMIQFWDFDVEFLHDFEDAIVAFSEDKHVQDNTEGGER